MSRQNNKPELLLPVDLQSSIPGHLLTCIYLTLIHSHDWNCQGIQSQLSSPVHPLSVSLSGVQITLISGSTIVFSLSSFLQAGLNSSLHFYYIINKKRVYDLVAPVGICKQACNSSLRFHYIIICGQMIVHLNGAFR